MLNKQRIKITGGTAEHSGPSLCTTCTHAYRRVDNAGEHNVCHALYYAPQQTFGKVYECKMYHDETKPSLGAMKEIAWDLHVKGGRVVGFKPPDPNTGTPDFD